MIFPVYVYLIVKKNVSFEKATGNIDIIGRYWPLLCGLSSQLFQHEKQF